MSKRFKQVNAFIIIFLVVTTWCKGNTPHIAYAFAHGWGQSEKDIKYYQDNGVIPLENAFASKGPEVFRDEDGNPVSQGDFGVADPKKTVFAQEEDIKALWEVIKKNQDKYDGIVGIGVSKGASLWLNTVAEHAHEINKVRCIIVESPFMDANEIAYLRAQEMIKVHYIPLSRQVAKVGTSLMFPRYKVSGIQPINELNKIPKNLPILFIHAKTDANIYINNSRILYKMLRRAGHDNVYLLELDHGFHANLFRDPEIKEKYVKACQEFTAKFVKHKNINLSEYQPPIEEVEKHIATAPLTPAERTVPRITRGIISLGVIALAAWGCRKAGVFKSIKRWWKKSEIIKKLKQFKTDNPTLKYEEFEALVDEKMPEINELFSEDEHKKLMTTVFYGSESQQTY